MNKTIIIAIASFFLIGIIIGTQLHGCKGDLKTAVVSVKSDTITRFIPRTDTLWHTIELANNIPYTVWGHDTVFITKTERITGSDTEWISAYHISTDTATYIDTIREKDQFRAELFDTLYNNRIIGRRLRWANISPIEVKTIDNTITLMEKPTLVRLYLGADAYGGKTGAKINIDLAPSVSLLFTDRYMVDIGYYIFDQQITAGLKVRIGK